jgi:hypothetical protein
MVLLEKAKNAAQNMDVLTEILMKKDRDQQSVKKAL